MNYPTSGFNAPDFGDASFDDSAPLPPEPAEPAWGQNSGGEGQGWQNTGGKRDFGGNRDFGGRNNYGGEGRNTALDYGRQPPHDEAAEQGVLGGMLLSKDAIPNVIEKLKPEDFYRPAHQTIYEAILKLYGDGHEVDALIVGGELSRAGVVDRIGGPSYLHTLAASVPTAANAHYYAEIVAEKATLRRLVDAGTRIAQLGFAGLEGDEIDGLVDRAQQEVFGIGQSRSMQDYVILEDIIEPTMNELDQLAAHGGLANGTPTGFTELDALTNGLHAGQMIIIAARPGVGKSTIALDMMRSASIAHKQTSVIFSLEMSRTEIMMRLLSAEAKIKLADMRGGRLKDSDWSALAKRVGEIADAPLFIDDSPNMTMMEIRSKARQLKQQHDLKLIVVDYLQLMSSGKKVESRQQEVSEFSRQLKLLAKELEVPLIAISQLNRGPENRPDKRPQTADLRESGSLEQDADMVMLLYRPDMAEPESPLAGQAEIILAKHRGGPTGTVRVAQQLQYSRFFNMAANLGNEPSGFE
nr:replicative DNA helicase [Corynebacterium ulceribovis]